LTTDPQPGGIKPLALDSENPKLPQRLATRDPELTPRERKVAGELVAGYPHAGLEGATGLAEKVGVSAATVVRLAAKLGYAGYPELQRELRSEVEALLKTPLSRLDGVVSAKLLPATQTVSETFAAALNALDATRLQFDEATARAMAEQLVACRGRIIIIGEKKGRAIALYLYAQLTLARVELLSSDASFEADRLRDIGSDDIVIAIDVRRYLARTIKAALFAVSRGARLMVLADHADAPLARRTPMKLVAATEGAGAFDSYAALVVVADCLANLVISSDPAGARARLESGEEAWTALGIFI
jgi:DNA-binding MurR/RpiR family transcriptional regulator